MSYEAYVLTEESRAKLTALFPPKFPKHIGHHITHRFGVPRRENVPYGEQTTGWFEVYGYAEDDGIEALVVKVGGKEFRPDGKRYHITWSLDPSKGRKPNDSNGVIARRFFRLDTPPMPFGLWNLFAFSATFDYIA